MKIVVMLAIGILIGLIRSAGVFGKSRRIGSTVIFCPSTALRLVLFCGGVMFVLLALGFVARLGWSDGKLFALTFLGFAALELWAWPYSITVDESGIKQTHPFRMSRKIDKKSILSAVYDCGTGETIVYPSQGPEIAHKNYHVDSKGFRTLLERWKKVEELPR